MQYPIVTTLSINFTGVPQEQHGRYKGYWLTLEADEDSIIELDPRGYGDTYNIDEVYVKINGKQQYLWRAVGQESLPHERSECFGYGETVEVYLRVKYDGAAAKHFFKR